MGIENLHSGCYVVCKYDDISPYGRMVMSYKTEQEAREHIQYQCECMKNPKGWTILHIKDMEWISVKA